MLRRDQAINACEKDFPLNKVFVCKISVQNETRENVAERFVKGTGVNSALNNNNVQSSGKISKDSFSDEKKNSKRLCLIGISRKTV